MGKLILGVDGGNTKTDYFLFTDDGEFIDFYHGPTCSHEQFKNGYEGAYIAMRQGIEELLDRHGLQPYEIKAAVFGLAGVDTPEQKGNIERIVSDIGFNSFIVVNDSFLGIKAVTNNGYGVCSINGTGTSCGGIDKQGNFLQVGGIGWIVGDDAGGGFIARAAIRACYEEAYRCGQPTTLSRIIQENLDVTDKYYLLENISKAIITRKVNYTNITLAVFEEARKGDAVAIRILKDVGISCGKSVAGAIINLDFDNVVDVVLAGSVWVKGASKIMINVFKETINHYSGKDSNIIMLDVPPATGAIIWALELTKGIYPTLRERKKIIKLVSSNLKAAGLL